MNPDGDAIEEALRQAEQTETMGQRLRRAADRLKPKKDEPSLDECVTRLVRYIEVRAKDIGERMERSKQLREQT